MNSINSTLAPLILYGLIRTQHHRGSGDVENRDETDFAAFIAITAWGTIILADVAGVIGPSRYEGYALVVLFLMSCYGLHYIRSAGQAMPWIITWGGGLVIAWCMLIFYGTLCRYIRLEDFVTPPSFTRVMLLHLNAPLAALITSLVFAYPLVATYGRYSGVISIVLALPLFLLLVEDISIETMKPLHFTLVAFGTICLYVFLRVVPHAFYRACTKSINRTAI